VIGGGVIGNLIVKAIRLLEARCHISVAEPSAFHAELIADAGVDELITDGDLLGHAQHITGAAVYKPMIGKEVLMGGYSKIFDTVGSKTTLDESLRVLRTGGVLSLVAIGKETPRI
jgi:(R,R)-butanediol dehydrogenase / meso-butanediol dehydrogenase / diacetyl reductase